MFKEVLVLEYVAISNNEICWTYMMVIDIYYS